MADEFDFRVLDARRKVDVIQDELRRQVGAFLAESDSRAGDAARSTEDASGVRAGPAVYTEFTAAETAAKSQPDTADARRCGPCTARSAPHGTCRPRARTPPTAHRRRRVKIDVADLNFYYGAQARARGHHASRSSRTR